MAIDQVDLCFSMSSLIVIQQFNPSLFMWQLDSKNKQELSGLLRDRCRTDTVTLCHILLVKANHRASPDSRGGKYSPSFDGRGSMYTFGKRENFGWSFFVIFCHNGGDVQNSLIKDDFIKNIICKLSLYLFLSILLICFYFMHLFIPTAYTLLAVFLRHDSKLEMIKEKLSSFHLKNNKEAY